MYENVLIFLVLLVSTHAGILKQDDNPVCLTPGCVKSAARILDRLDSDVDPCDNFYKFACGNFIKYTDIPQDQSSYSSFEYLNDLVNKQVKLLLDSPITENDPKSDVLVKKLYKQCMDTKSIDRDSMRKLKESFQRTGGWPVLEGSNWNASNFDLFTLTANFERENFKSDIFFNFYMMENFKNSSQFILGFDQVDNNLFIPTLRKSSKKSIMSAFRRYLTDVAVAFGADKETAEEDMQEALDIFINLAFISEGVETRRNISKLANFMTLREMDGNYTYFPFVKYVNLLTSSVNKELDENYTVMVAAPKYFNKLGEVFKTNKNKRAIANFMYAAVVTDLFSFLPDNIRDIFSELSKQLTGSSIREERWKQCAKVSARLSPALGSMYIKNYFKEDSKQKITKIAENVRQEFKKTLSTTDWMDDLTKQDAVEKLDSIKPFIAYPDEIRDENIVNNFYQNLTLDEDSYLTSILNIRSFDSHKQLERLDELTDETSWMRHSLSTMINAFYLATENSIDIRASILQDIFFDSDRPNYLNYGSIGYIIGHEITHGFDDKGKQFDQDGNLVNWWQPATFEAFQEKAKCIIDQYRNVSIPEVGMHLNGVNTQGENIADNGGVRESYKAYTKWVKHYGAEASLPGLSYKPEQLFWISVGTTWCRVTRPEKLRLTIRADPHAPSEARVNLPLMNNEFFAKDFNCPLGSNMNPVNKCSVW